MENIAKLFKVDVTKILQAITDTTYEDVQMLLQQDIDKNLIELAKLFEQ